MKLFQNPIWLFLFLACTAFAPAMHLMPDDARSSAIFTIQNFGIAASGRFTGLQGDIRFDPENLATSFFNVTVNVATIRTGISLRDQHLRNEAYFDARRFPTLQFVSDNIQKSAKGYVTTGTLMIKGTSRNLSIPFTALPVSSGYYFQGTFDVKRSDFNVGNTSTFLSDAVHVTISVFTK